MSAISHAIAGVSRSPRSLPALRYAAALARGLGAALIPLHTWVPPGGERAGRRCPSLYLRQVWEDDAWERLWDMVNTAPGGVPSDVPTEPLVVRCEAGWVLVHAASRAGDLLVIGTGRRGTVGRLVGGKVSRYCLAHACCPVMAVPPTLLELEAGHGLHRWAFRHPVLSPRELTASASGNTADPRCAMRRRLGRTTGPMVRGLHLRALTTHAAFPVPVPPGVIGGEGADRQLREGP